MEKICSHYCLLDCCCCCYCYCYSCCCCCYCYSCGQERNEGLHCLFFLFLIWTKLIYRCYRCCLWCYCQREFVRFPPFIHYYFLFICAKHTKQNAQQQMFASRSITMENRRALMGRTGPMHPLQYVSSILRGQDRRVMGREKKSAF